MYAWATRGRVVRRSSALQQGGDEWARGQCRRTKIKSEVRDRSLDGTRISLFNEGRGRGRAATTEGREAGGTADLAPPPRAATRVLDQAEPSQAAPRPMTTATTTTRCAEGAAIATRSREGLQSGSRSSSMNIKSDISRTSFSRVYAQRILLAPADAPSPSPAGALAGASEGMAKRISTGTMSETVRGEVRRDDQQLDSQPVFRIWTRFADSQNQYF